MTFDPLMVLGAACGIRWVTCMLSRKPTEEAIYAVGLAVCVAAQMILERLPA
jgi:hypothetical protein